MQCWRDKFVNKDNIRRIRTSPIRIAYYVQNMSKIETDQRKIILAIMSQFDKKDVMEFARKYKYCLNNDSVRHTANLISSIPEKALRKSILLDSILRDIRHG